MCVSPANLPSGVSVPCRKCWQCRENRVNDWVGRCIAETETATASSSITLTYGGGMHERAAVLTYSDVQKYFKLLRRHGFPLRYFAVGEYGSVKGRSHWHLVVFWQDRVPPHDAEERFMEPHWPHGWSYWERPSAASIRYVCKYIQKDIAAAERQGHLAMSKKPPLGAEYFERLARRYVEQGLAPQAPTYSFADVRDARDKPLQFYMHGVTRDNFCAAFLRQWRERNSGHPPYSPLIEEYCDRMARVDRPFVPDPFKPRVAYPWIEPPGGVPIQFSEPHNAFYCDPEPPWRGKRLWWSFDAEGNRAWHEKIRVAEGGDQMRILMDARRYREASEGA